MLIIDLKHTLFKNQHSTRQALNLEFTSTVELYCAVYLNLYGFICITYYEP